MRHVKSDKEILPHKKSLKGRRTFVKEDDTIDVLNYHRLQACLEQVDHCADLFDCLILAGRGATDTRRLHLYQTQTLSGYKACVRYPPRRHIVYYHIL